MLKPLKMGHPHIRRVFREIREILWEITKGSTVYEGEGFSSTAIVEASRIIQRPVESQTLARVSFVIHDALVVQHVVRPQPIRRPSRWPRWIDGIRQE